MWRRLGVAPDAGRIAKLRALKAGGLTTAAALQQAGLGAAEETQALSIILGDLPGYEAMGPKMAGLIGQEALLETQWEKIRRVPQIGYAQERAVLAARLWAARQFGPSAPEALERDIKLRETGVALTEAGLGSLVEEEGEPGWTGRALWSIIHGPRFPGYEGSGWIHFGLARRNPVIQQGFIINQNDKTDPAGVAPRVDR